VLCILQKWSSLDEHEDGEHHKMEAGQGFGQALIVAGQPAKARDPTETPFHDPPPGQQHKTLFGFGQLDDVQPNAVLAGGLAGVALIDKRHFDTLPGGLLNGMSQFRHLRAFLLAGRGHQKRQ